MFMFDYNLVKDFPYSSIIIAQAKSTNNCPKKGDWFLCKTCNLVIFSYSRKAYNKHLYSTYPQTRINTGILLYLSNIMSESIYRILTMIYECQSL